MGASWQTAEQKAFIAEHTPSYVQHATDETLKEFWPGFLEKWFTAWPISDPSPDILTKAGSMQSAMQLQRCTKISVSIIYPWKNRLELTVCIATEACVQRGHGGCC